jgi:hypothetical protein
VKAKEALKLELTRGAASTPETEKNIFVSLHQLQKTDKNLNTYS